MSAFSSVFRAEVERVTAECGELSTITELIAAEVRAANLRASKAAAERDVAKAVAAGILACRQDEVRQRDLEVASVLELLDHVSETVHDARIMCLVANVRRAMGLASTHPDELAAE